jgi:hypothetical protein
MDVKPSSLLVILMFVPGCLSTGKKQDKPEDVPVAPVQHVHATWGNQVAVSTDFVNGGRPLPGLTGRLYLVGADDSIPVKGDGKVLVDLYDGRQPQPRLHWEFDKVTLNRVMLRKDAIGWGYTLFLPWPDYRPDIKRVQLRVCYQAENSIPVYDMPAMVSLRTDDFPVVFEQRTLLAADAPPAPPPGTAMTPMPVPAQTREPAPISFANLSNSQ